MTYTYAILPVSRKVFEEIRDKLTAAGYSDQIVENDTVIDMHGLALQEEKDA